MLLFKFVICIQLVFYFLFGAVLYLPTKIKYIKLEILNLIELIHASKTSNPSVVITIPTVIVESISEVHMNTEMVIPTVSSLTNCTTMGCGNCENVTNEGGIIASPDYPGDYGNDRACIYIIQVAEDKIIQLIFNVFHVEFHYDWMDIIDGVSSGPVSPNITVGVSLTGYSVPKARNSSSNVLTIHFASDIDNSQMPLGEPGRWQATYKVI